MRPDAEVVVLERSRFTSYSACGIPFLVGGLIAGGVDALVARSPDEHRRRGIDVRTHHEAMAIDPDAGEVEFLDEHAGRIDRIGYDELLVATGGEPIRPDLPGIDLPFIHGVQSLDDAQALLALAEAGCRRIVVVGGGYIGLEMAEAYIERGCTATVIERSAQPTGHHRRRLRRARRRRHARPTASTSAAASASRASNQAPCSTSDGPVGGRPRGARHRRRGRGRSWPAAAGIELGVRRTPSSSTSGRRRRVDGDLVGR